MTTRPVTIPGVQGEVSADVSAFGATKIMVDGQEQKQEGFFTKTVQLPAEGGGTKEAKVKGGMMRAYPVLVVDGEDHPTGPPTPTLQQGLAFLPLLGLVLIQGALGFLLVFGGVALSMSVVRSDRPDGTKVGLQVAIGVGVVVICLALAVLIYGLLSS